jgi:hypothetical protein
MATFLELCRDLRQEAGIAGTGPNSVLGQSGESKRIVDWVRRSYNDIQLESSQWRWLTAQFQFTTTPGKQSYSSLEAGITARFDRWNPRSIRLSLEGVQDQIELQYISYDEFRSIYLTGPRPEVRPTVVSISPQQELLLGDVPNLAYTVVGEYQKTLQTLQADSDAPEMPAQYHDAILYWALTKYARYESAPEIYQDAMDNYRRLMGGLRQHQLPFIAQAEPLA